MSTSRMDPTPEDRLPPHVAEYYPPQLVDAGGDESGEHWPEPEPMIGATESTPYPMDALPSSIQEAVAEVNAFTQSPECMAACSALSTLSLAAQGLADVRRTNGLEGPTALYFMTIAESGERKSSLDQYFHRPIREHEHHEFERAKPEMANHRADEKSWEARVRGLQVRIAQASKGSKSTAVYEEALRNLEQSKPSPPRIPRLLYSDATPEAMGFALAEKWPLAGVVSSEAGSVLGAHGMGKDTILRNLAFYNSAWDGRMAASDRRTVESTRACPVRLTVALQAQPEAARAFNEKSGHLARGTGFWARFLVSWPKSTQGSRMFRDEPPGWPNLMTFQGRIRELLDTPICFDQAGDIELPVLDLTPEAKGIWIEFYNRMERELRPSGAMSIARDFAAKAADNAARLAALLHIYSQGPEGNVRGESMQSATQIIAWHCLEAVRFVGDLALPRSTVNALAVEAWLLDRCQAQGIRSVGRREIRQYGPGATRDSVVLNEGLAVLAEAGRVRERKNGRRSLIQINPALLGDTQ